ncbi:MAG: VOC family protein [Bryobacteraceae bacterium]|jgi:catechol 2,3-dioxygenase-like lactoylglutathione lyase family enzyme
MRGAFILPLLTALLSAADLRIDHVTVAGTSLKELQANLSAAGIPAVYGGAHTNGATEMALVSFPDGSYLELMALQADAGPNLIGQHPWARFLQGNAGPCAWAAREKDLAAEVKRLQAAGIPVSVPVRSGRQRPDGVRLDWETSDVGTEPRGAFFPFLIRDLTPRELRAFPQAKPVNRDFRGVAKVVIAVRDLDAAVKRYRQAYGLPAPIQQVDPGFGAHLALLGGVPVVLAQPLTLESWLSDRLDRFGEAPCAFVLGASRPGRYHAASQTRWFGIEISWFDSDRLGWRLGFETPEW